MEYKVVGTLKRTGEDVIGYNTQTQGVFFYYKKIADADNITVNGKSVVICDMIQVQEHEINFYEPASKVKNKTDR